MDAGGAAKREDEQQEEKGGDGAAMILKRAKVEACRQLWLALPIMGTNLVQFSMQLISVMLLGHLGELALSSAAISSSFANVTGFSLLVGLSTALETLCGQAYGAKQYRLLGIHMQRAMIVLFILAIPISILWYNVEHVLLFFRQSPDIAKEGGAYARFLIPGLFAYAFLQPLFKFLQMQSKVLPMFLCSSMTLVLHIGVCYTFVFKLGWGNRGAALAASVSHWLNVTFLTVLISSSPKLRLCWQGFSLEALQNIQQFLKLALPSAVMVCLEWWSFEALVLLSGILPKPELETSVLSILLNMISLFYMISYGIGTAASTRISNELGAGRPAEAKFAFRIAMALAVADACMVSTTLYMLRNLLGRAYSNEAEIIQYVAKLVPFLSCISSMDAIQGIVSGVSRGCGWQAIAACANLGAYYMIGLPLGYTLAFRVGLGGKGLLIGILAGVSTQSLCLILIATLTNWKKQAEAASERLKHSIAATTPLLG